MVGLLNLNRSHNAILSPLPSPRLASPSTSYQPPLSPYLCSPSLPHLTGLPTSWSAMVGLLDLNVSHNAILFQAPVYVSALTRLTSLDVSHVGLVGPLPSQWSTLAQLRYLDASG